MPNLVNLDALIPRQDLEPGVTIPGQTPNTPSFKMLEMEIDNNTRYQLRKPGFQRETNAWDPKKIVDLIKSFLDGDLIPAVIVWKAHDGSIFVVDGSHRLSALIAWAINDYGDGVTSREFFQNRIPQEQLDAASATRKLVDKTVGTYAAVKLAGRHDGTGTPEQTRWGRELSTIGINLQWIHGGVEKAERSFKAINGKATPIDPTEMRMIDDRKKPFALAARAISHRGTGHSYWGQFPKETKDAIESAASEIHKMLFEPEYSDTFDTIELPVAGKAYSGEGVKLVFDLVLYASRGRRSPGAERTLFGSSEAPTSLSKALDDESGEETLEYLKLVRKTVDLITGMSTGSLGLHPAVYYYSSTGSRQPAAFFAAIHFLQELRYREKLIEFTGHRKEFEEFLVKYKDFINQTVRKRGGGPRGIPNMVELFNSIYEGVSAGHSEGKIAQNIVKRPNLEFLKIPLPITGGLSKSGASKTAKNAAFIREALASAIPCAECGARIHRNSFSRDHNKRREDGGDNSSANLVITHWFCNSGYKEHRVAMEKKKAKGDAAS